MKKLEEYQKDLENYGYSCEFLPKSDEIPVDITVVDIGEDSQGRERQVTLRLSEADLTPAINADNEDLRKGRVMHHENFIHYYCFLPFSYEDKALGDLARLLLFLNKGMDFTGFGLSEADRRIYFQYTLHATDSQVTKEIMLSILGLFELMLDALADKVELVASGQKTANEVIKQALEDAKNFEA